VDPLSKKALLNVLSQTVRVNGGAAVLTTHSMSEAEGVCTNVGILVNGGLVCDGNRIGEGEEGGFGEKRGV
jgi:ABC-type multidrug transport system ATPase subunit